MSIASFARNLLSAPNVRDSKAADPFRSVLNRMTMFGGYRNGDREDTNNAYALAMTSAWAYSDIKLISERIAGNDARMKVQKRDDNGELADQADHAFHALLNRPNSFMSGSFLLRYTAAWYLLRGNGYLFISTPGIGRGEPYELWPLPANQVLPRPDLLHEGRGVFAGEAVIDYQYNVNGALEILPGENIIHFRMPNPFDWWEGLSPLQAAILGIQSDHAQAVWQRDFFKEDNAIPSAIISVPQETSEMDFDRQRDMLSEQLRSGQKRIFTRSGDLTVQMISQTLEQMQIIQSREFNQREIDNVYGVPQGLTSGGLSGDSRLAAEIAFARNVIQPMLDYYAEQFNADLSPYYGENVRIVAPNVIPQDRALEIQEYTVYAQDRTINENRKTLGMGKIELDPALAELQPFVDLPVRLITAALSKTGAQNVEVLATGAMPTEPNQPQNGTMAGAQDPKALTQQQAGKALKAAEAVLHSGVMLAFFIPKEIISDLAELQKRLPANTAFVPPDEFHITLCYLGDINELDNGIVAKLPQCVAEFAAMMPSLSGCFNGIGRFQGVDTNVDALYISFDSKALLEWRAKLMGALAMVGIESPSDHGFIPHITLGYVPSDTVTPMMTLPDYDITFDSLWLALGDNRQRFTLQQAQGVSKAQQLAIDTELARWRKVAVKAFKDGKAQREFVSDIIPATHKANIAAALAKATNEDEIRQAFETEDGSDHSFFTERITHDAFKAMLLQLDPDDDEAEQKLRMAVEARSEKRVKKAFDTMIDTLLPQGVEDPNEIEARFQRYYMANQNVLAAIRQTIQDGVDLGVNVSVKQLEQVGMGFDWTLSNQRAHDWVGQYSLELIKGIDATSRTRTQQALQRWIDNGDPLSSLVDALSSIFGPARAGMIAATETTRAYAQGNLIGYQDSGVVNKWRWAVANDEKVCPICGPLAGKEVELGKDFDGYSIPAHVGCRCWALPVLG